MASTKAVKKNAFAVILLISGILALAGVIVYLVNNQTGYMASIHTSLAPLVVILPLVAVICAIVLNAKPDLLKGLTGFGTLVLAIVMAAATVLFVQARVDVIGDMLNPVNHPDAQVTAVTWSLVGIALYCLSFLGLVITTLSDKLIKE
ncbi:MAG: hypothetical protein IJ083_00350 [Clostridia bacterium]|nr:hypothetical protein [Clostridia bacterium]